MSKRYTKGEEIFNSVSQSFVEPDLWCPATEHAVCKRNVGLALAWIVLWQRLEYDL